MEITLVKNQRQRQSEALGATLGAKGTRQEAPRRGEPCGCLWGRRNPKGATPAKTEPGGVPPEGEASRGWPKRPRDVHDLRRRGRLTLRAGGGWETCEVWWASNTCASSGSVIPALFSRWLPLCCYSPEFPDINTERGSHINIRDSTVSF